MKRWGLLFVGMTACYGDAEFRPAKDAHDLPRTKNAFRVTKVEDVEGCRSIGFVRNAGSIEDIADTTASNGGTHYRVLEDYSSVTLKTDGVSSRLGDTGLTTLVDDTRREAPPVHRRGVPLLALIDRYTSRSWRTALSTRAGFEIATVGVGSVRQVACTSAA